MPPSILGNVFSVLSKFIKARCVILVRVGFMWIAVAGSAQCPASLAALMMNDCGLKPVPQVSFEFGKTPLCQDIIRLSHPDLHAHLSEAPAPTSTPATGTIIREFHLRPACGMSVEF